MPVAKVTIYTVHTIYSTHYIYIIIYVIYILYTGSYLHGQDEQEYESSLSLDLHSDKLARCLVIASEAHVPECAKVVYTRSSNEI